jgi:phosphopantetheinyl transferase (holo-ACP synthase)
MIGNDVVDLGDAESRVAEHHPRFDARVFTAAERELIAAGTERTRWLLWAAKESAYKAARRVDVRTVFSPSRFVVRASLDGCLTVDSDGRTFVVEDHGDGSHVHVLARARADGDGAVHAAVDTLPPGATAAAASVAVRRLALVALSARLAIPVDDLALDCERRMPRLWVRGGPCGAVLSLAHHGRFVAFACRWPDRGWRP